MWEPVNTSQTQLDEERDQQAKLGVVIFKLVVYAVLTGVGFVIKLKPINPLINK
ncbi:MAG: hypothetical protein HC880_20060 [Bacteroidia bacterium]|nr:hypothetical protein [Bacteroidia bacterium]